MPTLSNPSVCVYSLQMDLEVPGLVMFGLVCASSWRSDTVGRTDPAATVLTFLGHQTGASDVSPLQSYALKDSQQQVPVE